MSSDYPIPQTDALRQANPRSMHELFSLDPEQYENGDREAIIRHMQELRTRLASTETVRQVRVRSTPTASIPRVVTSAAQLGLVKRGS